MIFSALLIEILADKHYYWRGFLGIFWLSGTQNGGLSLIMRVIFRKNMIMKELTPVLRCIGTTDQADAVR